jgi:predicted CoA-substrate-specific enzyme activase
VGGQDTKVISLDENGKVVKFQMNDRCAAGTGRFLEIMAGSLGYALAEFGQAALEAAGEATISSMCTVFAESEVISMKNHGTPPENIARAVHLSVVDRLTAMLHRVGLREDVVFSGGVANNPAVIRFVENNIERSLKVPECPDVIGALGAALSVAEVHHGS